MYIPESNMSGTKQIHEYWSLILWKGLVHIELIFLSISDPHAPSPSFLSILSIPVFIPYAEAVCDVTGSDDVIEMTSWSGVLESPGLSGQGYPDGQVRLHTCLPTCLFT